MTATNPCRFCIGERGAGEDCCIDVFIILNPDEMDLFEKFPGFCVTKEKDGAVFYTKEGCPYLDKEKKCSIHDFKPLYCKFYPIFITGIPYTDDKCPAYQGLEYNLTSMVEKEIRNLQKRYPIYKKEWLWEDVERLFHQ
ncbi:hypothetical protein CEE45_12835 [Candidatus Heimdallarchaeota archaeon B3_Heim]|nr:MAG: hypothetical protein CEE45_12835 [Candidatus Heimdallarchaeota archaeon B3_Heim]